MKPFKTISLIGYLSAASFAFVACSHTKPSQKSTVTMNAEALKSLNADTLLNLFNFDNVMELMEAVTAKDENYDGPAHLHPLSKTMLQKTFLPHYFDTLDKLHSSDPASIKANFIASRGHQTQSVTPLNLTNIFLFLNHSKKNPDEPINEDVWGSLTSRQLFTALEFPPVEKFGINITVPNGISGKLTTNTSLSETNLTIEAKDEMDQWVYTLDMPIGSDSHEIKFTAKNFTETYTVKGMATDAVNSIKVNKNTIFENPTIPKISYKLREKLDILDR